MPGLLDESKLLKAGVATPTPVQNYALGRDCVLDLLFQPPSSADPNAEFSVGMRLCISEGNIAFETDIIEIPSNCQKGWKVKLPGLKSGSVTFTGYAAISTIPQAVGDKLSLGTYLGDFCQVALYHAQEDLNGVWNGESAFDLEPMVVGTGANGVVRNLNVTVSPDDVCKVQGTIELTGAQEFFLYMAVAGFQG